MGFKPRRFRTRISADDNTSATAIDVPFDPKDAFGRARAPVVVSVGKHRYRTTTFTMGGRTFVPLAKKHRDAAGVEAGDAVEVTMALDEAPRVIETPPDLARALRAVSGAKARWDALSFTHQREHVEAIEQAVRPETRARRIAKAIEMLSSR